MCSFNKRNCIVDKSLKIIKLIKNAVCLILDNSRIVGFSRFRPYASGFVILSFPHFDSILSSKYFILKDQRAADRRMCNVLNITLLVHAGLGGNAESFICRRAPHFSTVSGCFRVRVMF